MAEVGRLSANSNNAFNSFVQRVFANLKQKMLFLRVLPISQKKIVFALSFVTSSESGRKDAFFHLTLDYFV